MQKFSRFRAILVFIEFVLFLFGHLAVIIAEDSITLSSHRFKKKLKRIGKKLIIAEWSRNFIFLN